MTSTVTLSVEVELGWGVHDLADDAHLSADGRPERNALGRLLDRCDDLSIPVSFDAVGHLLLSSCDGDHAGGHDPGWFDADPGTDAEADPLFYAPDAVAEIARRPAGHELCTHTFSHVPPGVVDDETMAWELASAGDLHRGRLDGPPRSLVPPRHSPPSRGVVRDAGLRAVRLSRPTSGATRIHRFKELLAGPLPLHEPRVVDGLVETYCTNYPSLAAPSLPSGQRDAHPAFAVLPVALRQRLHRRRLSGAVRQAAESGGHCHLWCHLYDLANDRQWPPVRAFLGDLAAARDRGDVAVVPMRDLADRVRAERSTPTGSHA